MYAWSLVGSLLVFASCAMAQTPSTTTPPSTTRASDPIDALRWDRRIAIVFSSPASADKLAVQREWFARDAAGLAERRLSVVEIVGDAVSVDGKPAAWTPEQLADVRGRFGGFPEAFRVVLVGLDGGVKLQRDDAVWPAMLFEIIDRMPMRREELQRQGDAAK